MIEVSVVAKAYVFSYVARLPLKQLVISVGLLGENLFPKFLCQLIIKRFNASQVDIHVRSIFLDKFFFANVIDLNYLMVNLLD